MTALAANSRPGLAERLAYGMGDFGWSLPYNVVAAYLLYFDTVVLGLSAAAIGTILVTARLFDAVVDLVAGLLIDRTRSRWGRTRPWIVFTALPYAAVFVAVFAVPQWGPWSELVWTFVTFNLLGLLMSFGSIAYTALLPMVSADPADRMRLGAMRSIGTSLSVIAGTALPLPLAAWLGTTLAHGEARWGFAAMAALFALPSTAALLALFTLCRERHVGDSAGRPAVAIGTAVAQMLGTPAWWVCFGFTLLYFVRFGTMISVTAFFAIAVLGKPWLIGVMLPAVSGMLLLAAFVAPTLYRLLGLRRGALAALALGWVLFALLPLVQGNVALFLAVYFAASFVTSLTITATFTMVAATVDIHEALFAARGGQRQEGLISAGISLATKIGMALGGAAIAYALAWGGFRPDAVTPAARQVIAWSYYGWPLVLLALQALVMLGWRDAPAAK